MSYKLSTNTQAFKKAVFYNMANMQNQLSYKTIHQGYDLTPESVFDTLKYVKAQKCLASFNGIRIIKQS